MINMVKILEIWIILVFLLGSERAELTAASGDSDFLVGKYLFGLMQRGVRPEDGAVLEGGMLCLWTTCPYFCMMCLTDLFITLQLYLHLSF